MPKSCCNCQKYPMCQLYRKVSTTLDEEAVLDNTMNVFVSIASHCRYYKEEADV